MKEASQELTSRKIFNWQYFCSVQESNDKGAGRGEKKGRLSPVFLTLLNSPF